MKIFNAIQLTFRFLLTIWGAFALLYVLSFPYSFIGPNPVWDYAPVENEHIANGFQALLAALAAPLCLLFPWYAPPVAPGLTPEPFRPWLCICPWLLMELASCLGDRRNLVWFGSIVFVLLSALIAWPVLQASNPEYIRPEVVGDDGKLTEGVIRLGIFTFFSLIFRKALLEHLFGARNEPSDDNINYADADVLDPANARTVRQIIQDPSKSTAHFRYGEADKGLIARFYAKMKEMAGKRLRTILIVLGAGVSLLLWFFLYPQPTKQESVERDLAAMYEQSPIPSENNVMLGTTRAVNSAYRLFSHLATEEGMAPFIGKDDADLISYLRLDNVDPAYVRTLRSNSSIPSWVDSFMPDKDDRFMSISDGKRAATLLVHHDGDGKISSLDIQFGGWNLRSDFTTLRNLRKMRSRIYSAANH